MSKTSDRRDSRFFSGDEHELQNIKNKERLQSFVRRRQTRKRFSRFTYIALLCVLVALFIIICLAIFFRIDNIEVIGSSRYSKEKILSITGIEKGLSLYEVGDGNLEKLYGKLSYISDAHITRKLPDTVIISVTEDVGVYYSKLYGEYFILSEELRVLERVFDSSEFEGRGLIELLLPQIDSAVVGYDVEFSETTSDKYVHAYIDALESSPLFKNTSAFDLRDRFSLSLIAQKTYLVKLGNGDELGTKFTAVAGMLESAVFSDGVPATIDANDPTQCPVIKNPDLKVEFDS